MWKPIKALNAVTVFLILAGLLLGLGGCGGSEDGEGGGSIAAASESYVLFAWNDLGMHCLNPNYDTAVILPPYNTVWAQLVRRGDPPQIITSGVTLEYQVVNNTYSAGKTHTETNADYGQFWQYVSGLFGVALDTDTGLNLKDPTIHNGLSGNMVASDNHFEVDGIPLTPVDDSGTWNPYQVIEITARDGGGTVIAQTRATIPTSDEINCKKCHGNDPFYDILQKHDTNTGTSLISMVASEPILCSSCHGSPALGNNDPGVGYLSEVIHRTHATRGAGCYDCHPGATTKCNRSLAHDNGGAADGNCTACHGDMQQVAASIVAGRVPWQSEPRCATCHTGVAEVDTGTTLYRDAEGHGGLNCAACHGSPHAMVPSRESSDNYQEVQYQGSARSIGSCGVCHSSSRGRGTGDFLEQHGGGRHSTACNVCHTAINTVDTSQWPHRYQWKAR